MNFVFRSIPKQTLSRKRKREQFQIYNFLTEWFCTDLIHLIHQFCLPLLESKWRHNYHPSSIRITYIGPLVAWSTLADQQYIKQCKWNSFFIQKPENWNYTKHIPREALESFSKKSGILWLTIWKIYYPWKHQQGKSPYCSGEAAQEIVIFFTPEDEQSIQTFLRKQFPKFYLKNQSWDVLL